jgi:hypothetical protein
MSEHKRARLDPEQASVLAAPRPLAARLLHAITERDAPAFAEIIQRELYAQYADTRREALQVVDASMTPVLVRLTQNSYKLLFAFLTFLSANGKEDVMEAIRAMRREVKRESVKTELRLCAEHNDVDRAKLIVSTDPCLGVLLLCELVVETGNPDTTVYRDVLSANVAVVDSADWPDHLAASLYPLLGVIAERSPDCRLVQTLLRGVLKQARSCFRTAHNKLHTARVYVKLLRHVQEDQLCPEFLTCCAAAFATACVEEGGRGIGILRPHLEAYKAKTDRNIEVYNLVKSMHKSHTSFHAGLVGVVKHRVEEYLTTTTLVAGLFARYLPEVPPPALNSLGVLHDAIIRADSTFVHNAYRPADDEVVQAHAMPAPESRWDEAPSASARAIREAADGIRAAGEEHEFRPYLLQDIMMVIPTMALDPKTIAHILAAQACRRHYDTDSYATHSLTLPSRLEALHEADHLAFATYVKQVALELYLLTNNPNCSMSLLIHSQVELISDAYNAARRLFTAPGIAAAREQVRWSRLRRLWVHLVAHGTHLRAGAGAAAPT